MGCVHVSDSASPAVLSALDMRGADASPSVWIGSNKEAARGKEGEHSPKRQPKPQSQPPLIPGPRYRLQLQLLGMP